MMNKYSIRYWFTFEEVIRHYQDYDPWDASLNFYNLFHNILGSAPIFNDGDLLPHLSKLFNLMYSRNRDHYCFYQDEETIDEEEIKKFLTKIVNVVVMTYDRYAKLLDIYETKKDALMNPIKSSTSFVNKYNDTPQEDDNFDDDEHTTNINHSKSETETDGASVIARIQEISRAMENVLKDWSNEFSMFIEEV